MPPAPPVMSYDEVVRAIERLRTPGPPAAEDDPRHKRRRKILEAATELFIRHGYRKTSIDDVAEAAGIAKGTVYLYFKTKAELFLQAIFEEKLAVMEAMRPVFDPALPPRERLRQMLLQSLLLAPRMPLAGRMMKGDREILSAMDEIDPTMLRETQAIQDEFFVGLVAAASNRRRSTQEVRERAQVILGTLTAFALVEHHARRGMPYERYVETLVDILCDGALPPEPARAERR